jgi:hypothetical protein
MVTGPTGLGKTMFGVALAFATEAKKPFLHWKAGRAARVLYVDGEMSRREMQRRLREEAARAGRTPQHLYVLSREDFDDMLPLNTEAGQKWMDEKIAEVRPDLILFDNIQALLVGDNSKEESWSPVLPWMRSLTKRSIGQIWFHHTGHNEGHAYGTKTREWQLDFCILLERVNTDDKDLTFTIKFTKARARRPENLDDFADTTIRLRNNRWEITSGGAKKEKVPTGSRIAYDLLKRAIAEVGEVPPVGDNAPAGTKGVKVETWQRYCKTGSITKGEGDAFRKAFGRAAEKLHALGLICVWAEWVWIPLVAFEA